MRRNKIKLVKHLIEMEDYNLFKSRKEIMTQFTAMEFRALLKIEPFNPILMEHLNKLLIQFVNHEDYEYAAEIKYWMDKDYI